MMKIDCESACCDKKVIWGHLSATASHGSTCRSACKMPGKTATFSAPWVGPSGRYLTRSAGGGDRGDRGGGGGGERERWDRVRETGARESGIRERR